MNRTEALQILELNNDASEDQIKKQFKKLAAKNHPDVNKEDGAETKFKKINEAFQYLTNPQPNPQQQYRHHSNINLDDFFDVYMQNFGRQSTAKTIEHPTIKQKVTLTFEESVLGCTKSIKVTRFAHCQTCEGSGKIFSNNDCKSCNGAGNRTTIQGNMVYTSTCSACLGKGKDKQQCESCKGECGAMQDKTYNVKLKPGLKLSETVCMDGAGHFVSSPRGRGYDSVHLHIFVEPKANMKIDGINVVSDINLSLLEALAGTEKTVETVLGPQQLIVPAKSRHLETVNIPNAGVDKKGDHIFKLNVEYPENVDKLIETLQN